MNKLETACIHCGADRVYTHLNSKTAKWTVYCDTCVGGYDTEEEAVAAYMRVVRMREALEGIADSGCCLTPGCNVEDPMCDTMIARAALEEVNDE